MPLYVLDTSALMCLLYHEAGVDVVIGLLDAAALDAPGIERPEVVLPFVALMEVEYQLLRRLPQAAAQRNIQTVETLPVQIRESTSEWRHDAARVKAKGGLSLADAWIAALAIMEGAELVHKDPEFDQVPELRSLRLPYRGPSR